MQEFYSTSEVASIFNVTPKTIRNWDKEEKFIPVKRDDEDNRLYSREQIEEKLGKKIEESIDPILFLKKEEIDSLISIAQNNESSWINGDTFKEKTNNLVNKIYEKSSLIYRQTELSGANFILCCPELSSLLEFGLSSSFSKAPYKEEMSSIQYAGIVNFRWKLYITPMLAPNTMLIGLKADGEILKTPEAIVVLNVLV